MTNADIVSKVVTTCLEKGLISFWFLSCPSSFRIAPPLTISDEEIDVAQIEARTPSGRIVVRQVVEDFGFDDAGFHE